MYQKVSTTQIIWCPKQLVFAAKIEFKQFPYFREQFLTFFYSNIYKRSFYKHQQQSQDSTQLISYTQKLT